VRLPTLLVAVERNDSGGTVGARTDTRLGEFRRAVATRSNRKFLSRFGPLRAVARHFRAHGRRPTDCRM
jgi:hypothetical protein